MSTPSRRAWALCAIAIACGAPASTAQEPAFDAAERGAIERIVEEYLLAHPEVLVEALRVAEERRLAEEREARREAILSRHDELVNDPDSPGQGAADADVVIVEFLDFRCGFCRKAHPVVGLLLAEDAGVRVVYKDFPILGPDSVVAARAALAAHRQGKYVAMHDLFYTTDETIDADMVLAAAAGLGLDMARFRADMDSAAIESVLAANHRLALDLGIDGTPAFVVGATLIPGYATIEQMRVAVAEERGRLANPD
jgi:protein-disulfide isomerase